jgi:hypothetical protein
MPDQVRHDEVEGSGKNKQAVFIQKIDGNILNLGTAPRLQVPLCTGKKQDFAQTI